MYIIIKFILRNIKEKKFRTFLIIFSLTISAALYFATGAITGTVEKMYISQLKRLSGSSDILISANTKSPSDYFNSDTAKQFSDRIEYLAGMSYEGGRYEYKQNAYTRVELIGINYEDMQKMNPVTLEKSSNLLPFSGRKIIIGKTSAEKYDIKIGDLMDVFMGDQVLRLEVCGIAKPTGFYSNDGQTLCAVLPRSTVSMVYSDSRNQVNSLYIKAKDPGNIAGLIKYLSHAYNQYTVKETLTQSEKEEQTKTMKTALSSMSLIVLFISAFIIYTCFNVITVERLPYIGTFRSIGAEKRTTTFVLLWESLIYGTTGGIAGSLLGVAALHIMTRVMAATTGVDTQIDFLPSQLLSAFVMAVVMAVASAAIPIFRVSRIPVKEIVLNKVESKDTLKRKGRLLLGLLALGVAVFGPRNVEGLPFARTIDIASYILCLFSAAQLAPYITDIFILIFERLYTVIFGNIGAIAAKNLRNNKAIINNITLLCIIISTVLVIKLITGSVTQEIVNVFVNSMRYQVSITVRGAERGFENQLRTVDNIIDTYKLYEMDNVDVEGTNSKIMVLQGVNKEKYPDYYRIDYSENTSKLLEELDSGRNIIISNLLKKRYNVEKGDTLTLMINNSRRSYKVIGFANTIIFMGDFAIISDRYFKVDIGDKNYSTFCIKTAGDPVIVADALREKFARDFPDVTVTSDLAKEISKNNEGMFAIQNGLSVMTMIIGIFGILNNLTISFIERKRSLAVYRSIGMERGQIVRMIFIEALTSGLIGGFTGVASGLLTASIVPYTMRAVGGVVITISYSLTSVSFVLAAGVAATLIASISPSLKSSKLNIIESIKYE